MHETSFLGLNSWYKNIFEKFGWMILAYRDGDKNQIISFKENIEILSKHINSKIKYLNKLNKKDKNICIIDKVNELKIMVENLLILHNYLTHLCKDL